MLVRSASARPHLRTWRSRHGELSKVAHPLQLVVAEPLRSLVRLPFSSGRCTRHVVKAFTRAFLSDTRNASWLPRQSVFAV